MSTIEGILRLLAGVVGTVRALSFSTAAGCQLSISD